MFLSDIYRTYYKATIKASTSVKRGYYKARHTRLSDNCITVIQIVTKLVIKLVTFMSPTYNYHFCNVALGRLEDIWPELLRCYGYISGHLPCKVD